MRCAVVLAIVAAAVLSRATVASAQTSASLSFSGTVDDACAVTTPSDGTLALSNDYTELSSKNAGGAAGSAVVISTDADNTVTVQAASGWAAAPAGGGTNVAYDAEYDASGATTASNVAAGNNTTLGLGSTTVSVDAWATKSSGVFPAGSYSMDVVVQCAAN